MDRYTTVSSTTTTVIELVVQLICILSARCTVAVSSWAQPQIGIQPGFLSIYSPSNNFVSGGELVVGQPYTLDIRMSSTDQFDYLLQRCTYNNKYHFVDENSCLVCDNFFRKLWETDTYQVQGAVKRTVIHFVAPEPLVRLDCSARVLQCCGCAERACGRNLLPVLAAYPQQVINLAVISQPTAGFLGASVASWPWWAWLLIILGLILLLCLLPLLLLLCSRLWMRKRKVADTKPAPLRPAPAEAPHILARAQELEPNGVSREYPRRPLPAPPAPPTRVYRTPSESPSESAHSTASRSRTAVVVRQQQPRAHWAETVTDRRGLETRRLASEAGRLERVSEEREQVDGSYREIAESGSRFQAGAGHRQAAAGELNTEDRATSAPLRMLHQQTTSEEKFFKKSDRRRGLIEEGYDRAQLTYTTPATHHSHSEIV